MAKQLNGTTRWVSIILTCVVIFGGLFAQGVATKTKLDGHIDTQRKSEQNMREDMTEIKQDIKKILEKL